MGQLLDTPACKKKCYKCNKFNYITKNCYSKNKIQQKKINMIEIKKWN